MVVTNGRIEKVVGFREKKVNSLRTLEKIRSNKRVTKNNFRQINVTFRNKRQVQANWKKLVLLIQLNKWINLIKINKKFKNFCIIKFLNIKYS